MCKSNFDLGTEFNHSVGRQVEEFHRALGTAAEQGEKAGLPDRHVFAGGDDGFTAEEEAGLVRIVAQILCLAGVQDALDIRLFHESMG